MFRVRAITNSNLWSRGDIFIAEGVKDCCHGKVYLISEIKPVGSPSTHCEICESRLGGPWWSTKCFERIDDISDSSIEELIEELKKTPFYKDIAYYLPDGRVFTSEQYHEMEDGAAKRWVAEYAGVGTKIKIAAPIELFDTDNSEIVDGYKLQRKRNLDPIVVAELPSGGYIELARWK